MTNPVLNSVSTVTATVDPGVFILRCNITDMEGSTYDTDYCSHPDDRFGLNPTIRKWLADNPLFPVQPYVPPTVEEIRALLRTLSRRQLLLALNSIGITEALIDEKLTGDVEGMIEWKNASVFERLHPLVTDLSVAFGLPPEQVDSLWVWASGL
ncbi:hypothetical protein GOB43_17895 [Sinorhizobium meliloti]|uniref:hypothetical protein n=1 Tax=Rhizobium meliloti TaxID=382 RepID=UPI000FE1363B|nr:hypothetical protein [Sinorhizobium meliloti]MDW9519137.1 hypothetical protein [Sinorhizobium meliloti]MDX0094240.1 hypothetical protein [Sinorhizobium meliloti]MDX0139258.1 hypothetical protein [Sinorhizobium meliloti]MDX0194064.1 hypothetical protein [Sinorhizobium meliloti]MDX0382597.1 hypothetical protein [Sinorhizobium meliloti]